MDISKSRQRQYLSSKCQNLVKEYGDILIQIQAEVLANYSRVIPMASADSVALEYMKQQGAKESINLFIKLIHDKANDRGE